MFQIRHRKICSAHETLPEYCFSCQIQAFFLCLKEVKISVPKDLCKLIFKEISKDFSQKGFMKLGLNSKIEETGKLETLYRTIDKERKKIKIRTIFIGPKKAWGGFLLILQRIQDSYLFDPRIKENIPETMCANIPDEWMSLPMEDYVGYWYFLE